MRFAFFIALAAAFAVPSASMGQEPERVRPGAPLDMTFIRPGVDSVAMVMERDGETFNAGFAVLETRIDSAGGTPRVVYVQRMYIEREEPILADSLNAHWQTLLPISSHSRGDSPRDYFFGPGSVRIVSLRDSTESEVALDAPVFHNLPDLLLRALPLRVGYRAVVPVLSGEERDELRIAVTGEEDAQALDGGTCRVLVVEVEDEWTSGTFRVSTADRSVVRYDSDFGTLVRPTGCR